MDKNQDREGQSDNHSTEEGLVNQEDIKRYLEFISGGREVVYCGAWFDGKGEGERPIQGYGVWFGNVDTVWKTYQSLIEIGYKHPNFHVTLNETSDVGRKAENIEAPRVLCLDIDDENSDRSGVKKFIEGAGVQLAVESSGGKFHFYWAVKRDVTLEDWRVVQAGLAHRFKGDLNLSQINHCIRVPGFRRITKKGAEFTPTIVWAPRGGRVELGIEQIEELFYGIRDEGQKALAEMEREAAKESREASELARAVIGQTLTPEGLKKAGLALGKEGKRNSGLYQAVKIYCKQADVLPGKAEAIEYGRALNDAMPRPMDESEVRGLSIKAWRKAKKIRTKQEEDIHEAEKAIRKGAGDEAGNGSGEDKNGDHEGDSGGASVKRGSGSLNGKMPHGKNGSGILPAPVAPRGDDHGSHAKKSKLDKTKKKKKKTFEMRIERSAGNFEYDYSGEPLSLERFSDSSVAARVLQRYEGKIVKVARMLYAFDDRKRVWHNQKGNPTLLAKYAGLCCLDTIHDSRFIRELCVDRSRNINRDAEKKWKRHFLSSHVRSSVVSLLQTEDTLPELRPTDFDANPEILFCANGALNLRTGELREVRPEDYLLFCNRIEWNPDAECPFWIQCLSEIFSENDEPEAMVEFMQEIFGYSICGSISAKKMFVHWGSGSNGKSKVLEVLASLMGDYVAHMECKSFSKNKAGFSKDVERRTVKSEGKRVLILDDLETKSQWDESLIKTFTAKTLPMEKKYQEGVDIPNRAKIHIGCNEPPTPESENFGLIRRLYLISYHHKFKQNSEVDMMIDQKLAEEMPGILKWAVEGYQRLVENGFNFSEPEQITADEDAYKSEHFKLTNLLNATFEKAPIPKGDRGVANKKIMESDEDWHDINDLTELVSNAAKNADFYDPISMQWLSLHLKEQFQAQKRRKRIGKKRVVQYRVRLLSDEKGQL